MRLLVSLLYNLHCLHIVIPTSSCRSFHSAVPTSLHSFCKMFSYLFMLFSSPYQYIEEDTCLQVDFFPESTKLVRGRSNYCYTSTRELQRAGGCLNSITLKYISHPRITEVEQMPHYLMWHHAQHPKQCSYCLISIFYIVFVILLLVKVHFSFTTISVYLILPL